MQYLMLVLKATKLLLSPRAIALARLKDYEERTKKRNEDPINPESGSDYVNAIVQVRCTDRDLHRCGARLRFLHNREESKCTSYGKHVGQLQSLC